MNTNLNSETVYLFDVDGTLTPARASMRPEYAEFFRQFVAVHTTILVSGSDYLKITQQIPDDILDACRGVFGCSGAEYFERRQQVYAKSHEFPAALIEACEQYVSKSAYPLRVGNHLEFRPGALNISSVGRNASEAERQEYSQWDETALERRQFAAWVNQAVDGYEASVGGQISIDVVPDGWNKSSIITEINQRLGEVKMVFFGDRIQAGGNDLALANALDALPGEHRSVPVESDSETFAQLKSIMIRTRESAA
jgi:phosphomannomutase